jgi:hypothetical protein
MTDGGRFAQLKDAKKAAEEVLADAGEEAEPEPESELDAEPEPMTEEEANSIMAQVHLLSCPGRQLTAWKCPNGGPGRWSRSKRNLR